MSNSRQAPSVVGYDAIVATAFTTYVHARLTWLAAKRELATALPASPIARGNRVRAHDNAARAVREARKALDEAIDAGGE